MYNIWCKEDYEKILDTLKKTGNEVNGTYEEVGASICVKGSTANIKDIFNITDTFESDFVKAIATFSDENVGPYDTSKYSFIIPAIKKAIKQFVDDSTDTRRCVVQFPPEHCFQSVQFLIREDTLNVVCFMRSCDAIKNLPHDIWLCSKMADILYRYFLKVKNKKLYGYHIINMTFGSLHVYKEDL